MPKIDPDEALGARIRELRHARGLTLVQLAASTELSHPFLSQLERGLAQPSLGSLRRIAIALGTSPIELIAAAEAAGDPGDPVEVHSAGVRGVPDTFAAGEARMLAHGTRPFSPMEIVDDRVSPGEYFVHDEDEFLYVVGGRIVLDTGDETRQLAIGDAAYYAGGTPHRWWSADAEPFRLVVVKQATLPGAP